MLKSRSRPSSACRAERAQRHVCRDDRAATILAGLLRSLRANTKDNDLGTRLIGALASSALAQGTLESVETAVKQTKTFSGSLQEPAARLLHAELAEFATRVGAAPPDWSDHYSDAWHTWLEANRSKFPKKLGRLALPPTGEPSHALDGLPGKSG